MLRSFDSTRLALMFAVYNFDIGLLLQNSKKISTNKKMKVISLALTESYLIKVLYIFKMLNLI